MNKGFPGYPERNPQFSYFLGLGYDADMLHVARRKDDVDGFMHFLDGCGGMQCKTLDDASIVLYAARGGAVKVVDALIAKGATDPRFTTEELREKAELIQQQNPQVA